MTERFGGRRVIIQALTGSHNYNLNTPASDEDWKFFVAPTFEDLYKGRMFSNGKQSDEFDYTVHDIRQLSHLLWKANPNFVEVLFSTKFHGGIGGFPIWLKENADRISKIHLRSFGFACLGMHREKMSTLYKGTAKTQPIVDEFGYDTKDAHHALRVLLLAERVASGMPMNEAFWFESDSRFRRMLMKIKNNEVELAVFLSLIDDWHKRKFEQVEAFFKAQEPDRILQKELETRTMDFVKEQIMK
jgi:predicted nucleotidyltransferase